MKNFEELAEKYATVEVIFFMDLNSPGKTNNPWATCSTSKMMVEFFVDSMEEANEFLTEACHTNIKAPISSSYKITDSKENCDGIVVIAEVETTIYYN